MKRIAAILLALLLTLTLLFTACGPRAEQTPQPADRPEEGIDLVIVTDAPTDQTPTDVHANAPPETPESATAAPGTAAEEAPVTDAPATEAPAPDEPAAIDEDGWYYSKEDVALYIHTYGRLPGNFITKKEAKAITRGCCRRPRDGTTPSATSTPRARKSAARSGSSFPTTG